MSDMDWRNHPAELAGDDWYDDEPNDPCWCSWTVTCWFCDLPPARVRRAQKRRWQKDNRQWRKLRRHANDRFWRARNPAYFDEAPF